jgi:homogentisate 1,2-dioxygenase
MLIVAEMNDIRFLTELGIIDIEPGEIAVIPRGLNFRVELPNGRGNVDGFHSYLIALLSGYDKL